MGRDEFRRGFRMSEHRADVDRDVDDEIGFHHAMRERELMAAGLSEVEARRAAREAFGNEADIRKTVLRIDSGMVRRRRVRRGIESIVLDVKHSLRGMRRSPLFALIGIATLALAIGGNAVVFSLVEAVLLRAPAVASPDRLAAVWTTCRRGDPRCSSSYPDYEDYRDRSTRFSEMAAYTGSTVTADAGGGPEVVGSEMVTANYFTLLGLEPAAGRLLQPLDANPSSDPALMVLSYAWWQNRFGSDPGVVGSTLRVNGVPFLVVGVAQPDYEGLVLGQAPEFWTLLRALPLLDEQALERLESRGSRWIQGLVARLAPGATIEGARNEMVRISDQLAQEDPDARGPRTVTVDRLVGRVGGNEAGMASFLGILQGVVALTLLLACANLANLMVARASARRSETGVRLALGIGRRRLIRQHLIESLVLAAFGAVAAVAFAAIVLRLVSGISLPRGIAIGATGATLNPAVLGFLGAVTVLAALLCGGAPAFVTSRATVSGVLREQRSGSTSSASRLRSVLIAVQIALGCVMLVGATLFVGTLRNRLDVDLGFDADGIALVVVDPSLGGVAPDAGGMLAERLLERISALPGVTTAAAGRSVPVRPGGSGTFVEVDGYQPAQDEEMRVEYSLVTTEYLRTLQLPIVGGRDFVASDADGTEAVTIIDETMAHAWWPDRDPVGGTVRVGDAAFRVIGVSRRTAWGELDVGTTPFMFIPAGRTEGIASAFTLLVRTDRDPVSLLPTIRNAVRETEPRLAIRQMGSMRAEIDRLLAPQRTAAWLLSAFGILALAPAAIGIWGVVSHSVNQRRRDFGIRMALGASSNQVVGLVARTVTVPILLGLVAGLAAARGLSQTIDGLMFGVTSTDPTTYLVVALLLASVACLATWLPARRAAATDPVRAMRTD
jgi:predicted permease